MAKAPTTVIGKTLRNTGMFGDIFWKKYQKNCLRIESHGFSKKGSRQGWAVQKAQGWAWRTEGPVSPSWGSLAEEVMCTFLWLVCRDIQKVSVSTALPKETTHDHATTIALGIMSSDWITYRGLFPWINEKIQMGDLSILNLLPIYWAL